MMFPHNLNHRRKSRRGLKVEAPYTIFQPLYKFFSSFPGFFQAPTIFSPPQSLALSTCLTFHFLLAKT